ncbi:DUF6809 family protein [Paenibacillus rhizoplanae]
MKNVIPSDPQYSALCQQTSEIIETWKNRLTEEEFQQLEALLDLNAQTHGMELSSIFQIWLPSGSRHYGRGFNRGGGSC